MAETSNGRPVDLKAEIDREFEIAKARWGETFELMCLQGSRGDTLDDDDLLRMLRYFTEHGTIYSRVIAACKDLPR